MSVTFYTTNHFWHHYPFLLLLVDEERPGQLVDAVDRHHLDAFGAFGAFGEVARDDDAAEAQPRRLADALLGAGRRAHFAR